MVRIFLIYLLIFSGCNRKNYISLIPIDVNSSKPSRINVLFKAQDYENRPVSDLRISDFKIYENGEQLNPKDIFLTLKDEKPYFSKTIIAIDVGKNVSKVERSNTVLAFQKLILNGKIKVNSRNQVMVVVFGEEIFLVQDFTDNREKIFKNIDRIIDFQNSSFTNINGTIIRLSGLLKDWVLPKIEKSFLIVITENLNISPNIRIDEVLKTVDKKNIYMIGVGENIDKEALELIGLSGSYFIDDYLEDLESSLISIFEDIDNYAKSIYLLEYLSPQRGSPKNYILTLKIRENSNGDESGSLKAEFSPIDFKDATPYIEIKQSEAKLENGLILSAKSIWVTEKPVYIWEVKDPKLISLTIKSSDTSKVMLNFKKEAVGKTELIVKDNVNNIETVFPILLGIYRNINFNFQDGKIPKELRQFGVGWEIYKYENNFSIQNRMVQDNQETSLVLKGVFEGTKLSFDYKVSSEEGCDEMLFFIDGKGFYQSGLTEWSHLEYQIQSGRHTFEWKYRKDGSSYKYQDRVWIDNIRIDD